MKSIRSSAQSRLLIFCLLALAVFWLVTSDTNTIRQAAAFSAGVFVCCAVGTLAEVLDAVSHERRPSGRPRAMTQTGEARIIIVHSADVDEWVDAALDRPDDPIGH